MLSSTGLKTLPFGQEINGTNLNNCFVVTSLKGRLLSGIYADREYLQEKLGFEGRN